MKTIEEKIIEILPKGEALTAEEISNSINISFEETEKTLEKLIEEEKIWLCRTNEERCGEGATYLLPM